MQGAGEKENVKAFASNLNSESKLHYKLINTEFEANKVLSMILQDKSAVLGVDVEAAVEMSRFGILCLLQISYNEVAYIFDMIEMSYKYTLLKEIFEDKNIVKVFHDCSEDCSMLTNLYKFEMNNTFDTQIAHRMCYEDLFGASINTKHSSISLHDLLREYLHLNFSVKSEIHNLMTSDPYFWKKRPLTDKMLEYTANDVLYLPTIYFIIKQNCENAIYKNLNFDKILNECTKYLEYSKINLNIKNFNKISIEKDKVVEGLIKNFQKHCVFVQLNIGYNGIVTTKKTISHLMTRYKVGDIIHFKIIKLDEEKKRYILDVSDKQVKLKDKKENVNLSVKMTVTTTSSVNSPNPTSTETKKNKLNINVNSYFPSSLKNTQNQTPDYNYYNYYQNNQNNYLVYYPMYQFQPDSNAYSQYDYNNYVPVSISVEDKSIYEIENKPDK